MPWAPRWAGSSENRRPCRPSVVESVQLDTLELGVQGARVGRRHGAQRARLRHGAARFPRAVPLTSSRRRWLLPHCAVDVSRGSKSGSCRFGRTSSARRSTGTNWHVDYNVHRQGAPLADRPVRSARAVGARPESGACRLRSGATRRTWCTLLGDPEPVAESQRRLKPARAHMEERLPGVPGNRYLGAEQPGGARPDCGHRLRP